MLATLALCLLVGACSAAATPKLAVCDGRHRRPANRNGSVLATAETPTHKAPAVAKPRTTASAAASYAPCGDRS